MRRSAALAGTLARGGGVTVKKWMIGVSALAAVLGGTSAYAGPARAATPPLSYSSVNLGTLSFVGHGGERAIAINASGEIVGQAEVMPYQPYTGYEHATMFVPGGTNVDLGTLTGYKGSSEALALSDGGTIVGSAWTGTADEAVMWAAKTHVMTQLFPGEATGINNSGLVVGAAGAACAPNLATFPTFLTPEAGCQAVTWSHGHLRDLPGGLPSAATGVNVHGEVVGWVTSRSGQTEAAEWISGRLSVLGLGQAYAINSSGTVVGGLTNGPAVKWQGRTMTVLAPAVPSTPGAVVSPVAYAISDSGVVGGTCAVVLSYNGWRFPCVWSSHGVQTILSTSWNGPATGVSSAGDIVGFDGYYSTAMEWSPQPLPRSR